MSGGGFSLKDVLRIERDDRLPTALLFLWFLLTIASYYVVRPVRSTLVLFSLGPEALPWVYMGTALATGLAVWVFAKFSKARRSRLVGGTLVILTASLLFWWWAAGMAVAAREAGSTAWDWTSPLFYIWTDVFSSLAVTVFWMVANDVFGPSRAKHTFGVLAAAGPAGGFLGAWLAQSLAHTVGPVDLVLVAAGLFAAVTAVFLVLETATCGRTAVRTVALERPADLRRLREVVKTLASSRLLTFLVIVVCLERGAPDFVDWIFQTVGKDAVDHPTEWTAFFAAFDKWREVAVLVATFFVTPALLSLGGPTIALLTVPASIVLFAGGFAMWPVFALAVLMKGFEEGQRHAWFKAGKELTYTVTSRDVIYAVKGYIEVFAYRFARGLAGLLLLLMTTVLGFGPVGVAVAVLPLCVLWMWAIIKLGREFRRREAEISSTAVES